jgi:O-antigen/teichoic acid export membrane protein
MSESETELTNLFSGAGFIFIGSIIGAVSVIIERIIIGRALGPSAYGEISIGIAILITGGTFALLGFQQGIARYIPRFDDERDIRGIWLNGLSISLIVSILFALTIVYFNQEIAGYLFDGVESSSVVRLFAGSIPCYVGMRIGVGAIRGKESSLYRVLTQNVVFPGSRIVLLVVFLFYGFGINAVGMAYFVAVFIAFVVSHFLFNRLTPLIGGYKSHSRKLAKFSAPLIVSTLLSALLIRTDTVLLGIFQPSAIVGYYNAAYPIANGLTLVLNSFGFLYLPIASRLDDGSEQEQIQSIFRVSTKWIYILTFPLAAVFLSSPDDVLRVAFGPDFLPASTVLTVLTVGFMINTAAGRNRETISALGHTNYLLLITGTGFGLNIVLNLFLIPQYQAVGAAVASATSFFVMNALSLAILRVKFDISLLSWAVSKTFIVLPLFLLLPSMMVSAYIQLNSVLLVVLLLSLGLCTLVVVILTGCLNASDRIIIEYIEDMLNIRLPLVWRYMPDSSNQEMESK